MLSIRPPGAFELDHHCLLNILTSRLQWMQILAFPLCWLLERLVGTYLLLQDRKKDGALAVRSVCIMHPHVLNVCPLACFA